MIKKNSRQTLIAMLCLTAASALWGGLYVVSKAILPVVPPLTLMAVRYVLALAVLLPFWLFRSGWQSVKKLTGRDWLVLAAMGLAGYFLSILLQFWGTKESDAHTGALITASTPLFALVLGRVFLGEKMNLLKIAAIFLAMAGLVLTAFSSQTDGKLNFLGVLLLVGAAFTWAVLSVLSRLVSRQVTTLTVTCVAMFFALVPALASLPFESGFSAVPWGQPLLWLSFLYIGILSTAAAFFLWNKGLQGIDAGSGTVFLFIQSLVGSLLGVFFLGENLSLWFFGGALLIAWGIVLLMVHQRQKL